MTRGDSVSATPMRSALTIGCWNRNSKVMPGVGDSELITSSTPAERPFCPQPERAIKAVARKVTRPEKYTVSMHSEMGLSHGWTRINTDKKRNFLPDPVQTDSGGE